MSDDRTGRDGDVDVLKLGVVDIERDVETTTTEGLLETFREPAVRALTTPMTVDR